MADIDELHKQALDGTLHCNECKFDVCDTFEKCNTEDLDCDLCAVFQPNDFYQYDMCFSCAAELDKL
tara:strand:- start:1554 stop:1754 length:201 start_codon:yes stop_codon:yes gene_type:complete